MATSQGVTVDIVLKAAADLSAKQYYFVKVTADRTVNVCAAATDIPIGVLQNKPAAANRAAVVRVVGSTKLSANEAITVGWLLGTSADGQADRKIPGTDITEYTVGQALEGTGAAGDIFEAAVNCASPSRAA